MSVKRRNHSPEFKFRIALEATKEQKTVGQLAGEFNLHPSQISNWKKHLLWNPQGHIEPGSDELDG
jgi:transposase